jgi:hypothetical protein
MRHPHGLRAAAGNQGGVPLIGAAYKGGFFAGQIQVSSIIYNLVVAPRSGGENTSVQYKTSNTADTNPNSQNLEYGKLATDQFNDAAHPAFQWAKGLSIGGFSDWYIPAKNELEILYRNLNPYIYPNNTSSGANPNAVPSATSNYTSGDPAQTTVTAFQTGNSESFNTSFYWSSSENSASTNNAWNQSFFDGEQIGTGASFKNNLLRARAIRRVTA